MRSPSLPGSRSSPAPFALAPPSSDSQPIRSLPCTTATLSTPVISQILSTSSIVIRLSDRTPTSYGVGGIAPPLSLSQPIPSADLSPSATRGQPISSPESFFTLVEELPARLAVGDLLDLYGVISTSSQPELPLRLILGDLGGRESSSSFCPELPASLGSDSVAANFCGGSSAVQELPVSSVIPLPCKRSAVHGPDAKRFFEQAQKDPVHVAAPRDSESKKLILDSARQVTNQGFGFQYGLAPIPENEIRTFDTAPPPLFSILSRLSKSQTEIEDKIKNVHEGNVFLCERFNLLSNETVAKIENVQQSAGRAVQHAIARVSALETRNAEKERDFALSEARKEEEMKKIENEVMVLKEELENRKAKMAENREKSRKLWKYGVIGIGGLLVAVGAALLLRKN